MPGAITDTDYAALHGITDDVQGAAGLEVVTDVVKSNGLNEGDFVTRLQTFITQHNLVNAKLDADAGVTAEDYAATCNVTALVTSPTVDPGVAERGINDADLLTLMRAIVTAFNARDAKLDADDGTVDANYVTLLDISMPTSIGAEDTGIGQQEKTDFLEKIITNHNALCAKLDADA